MRPWLISFQLVLIWDPENSPTYHAYQAFFIEPHTDFSWKDATSSLNFLELFFAGRGLSYHTHKNDVILN